MKKLIILFLLIFSMAPNVSAMDYTAPTAPDSVQDLMPVETESFGQGLLKIIKNAMERLQPELWAACGVCLSVVAIAMLLSTLRQMPSASTQVIELAGVVAVSLLLITNANTMIQLGAQTVQQLSEYGKLLLPVMTGALAAQGGVTTSTALYTATAAFNAVLGSAISKLLVPLVYLFLMLSIAFAATKDTLVEKLRDFMKWLMSWGLKTVLYIFTGYMGITGVVSGSADAAALKAAKLTISGVVPMVGGILSDASEAVLVSAGVMKNAVGIYGLLAVTAIWIHPFLQLGIQYLLLKLTAAVCAVFDIKSLSGLIEQFSSAMGLLLGMTGSVCFLLLISTVCFMRGVG